MSAPSAAEQRLKHGQLDLERALSRAAARAFDPASSADALAALGRVVRQGGVVPGLPALRDDMLTLARAQAALSELDVTALDETAVALGQLSGDGAELSETELSSALAGLEQRDHVELVQVGAAALHADAVQLELEAASALVAFDELVRPCLFWLTPANEARGERAVAVAPAYRERFWWWCQGAAVAPSAVGALSSVAELLERFPEAQLELDRLRETLRSLAGEPRSKVISLRSWLARRASAGPAERLQVAAADAPRYVDLLRTPELEISLRLPTTLILDLHSDLRAGASPHALTASGRVLEATVAEHALDRFHISLDDAALQEPFLTVVVPFAAGSREHVLSAADPT